MNINAQNALLKTLEELPQNKHIFIVSNQRKYFLPTIYSRSSLISIKNPSTSDLNQWILDQGYIDFSILNFAPDSTPLEIEKLINSDMAGQHMDISQNLNSFCLGEITTPDLIKFYKEMNISFDEKINSIFKNLLRHKSRLLQITSIHHIYTKHRIRPKKSIRLN
jgi:site-specific DNA-adenine methylase